MILYAYSVSLNETDCNKKQFARTIGGKGVYNKNGLCYNKQACILTCTRIADTPTGS